MKFLRIRTLNLLKIQKAAALCLKSCLTLRLKQLQKSQGQFSLNSRRHIRLLLYIQHFDLLALDHLKDQLGLQGPVWFNPNPLPLSLSSSSSSCLCLSVSCAPLKMKDAEREINHLPCHLISE